MLYCLILEGDVSDDQLRFPIQKPQKPWSINVIIHQRPPVPCVWGAWHVVRGNAKGRFLYALDVGAGIGQGDSDSLRRFVGTSLQLTVASVAREKEFFQPSFFFTGYVRGV